MYLVTIAFKSLLREKRRTILSFSMFIIGITGFIFLDGMLEGFDTMSMQNLISLETAHIKVRSSAYDKNEPYDENNIISNYKEYLSKLARYPQVKSIVSRNIFLSEVDNQIDSQPALVIALDPEKDGDVFMLESFVEGKKLSSGSCYLGHQLAEDMNVKIGDEIYATFRTRTDSIASNSFIISGLIRSAHPKLDASTIVISNVDSSLFLGADDVNEISILLHNIHESDAVAQLINADFSALKAETWQSEAESFAALIETKKKFSNLFLLFIMLIGMVGIVNTMIMSVFQKQRQIGTLKALGMSGRQVRNIFLIEGLMIGLGGVILGVITGSLLNLYFVKTGLNLDIYKTSEGTSVIPNLSGIVYSVWSIKSYVISISVTLCGSVLAAYIPARKIIKMNPVESLRVTN